MGLLIAFTQIDYREEWDCLSRILILLLLFECKQIVLSQYKPSPEWYMLYLRQVFRKRDYFQRNPQQTKEVSQCFSVFAVRGIQMYCYLLCLQCIILVRQLQSMGNVECCQNQNSPDFRSSKNESKVHKNLVLKEVPLQQSIIKHDKMQKLEIKKQSSVTDNLNTVKKQTSQKQRMDDKSQVELYTLKLIQSRRQPKHLETQGESKQEKQHLTESKVNEYEIYQRESKQQRKVPELNPKVRATLEKNEFFRKQFSFQPKIINYSDEVYEGQTQLVQNTQMPSGFGKMYKNDGSLYVGEFLKGKAEGKGAYIFADGSHYEGNFKDNEANDENGLYKAYNFQYRGAFKNNTFHGNGSEEAEEHSFQGVYNNGEKVNGTLRWGNDNYIYKGPFKNEKFHGEGKLFEPTGEYQGDFYQGQKHGIGEYRFVNGLRYNGEYKNNKRNGKGTLFNPGSNDPAYEGNFQDGLPHGEGYIIDENGNRVSTKWEMGIDSSSL